jgi:hypothetical protein
MAGISQKITAVDVMPLLARNIYMQGYEGGNRPTEFLVLLNRYVQQARELATFASNGSVIRVANCEEAKPLLKILGYRVREECGFVPAHLFGGVAQTQQLRCYSTLAIGPFRTQVPKHVLSIPQIVGSICLLAPTVLQESQNPLLKRNKNVTRWYANRSRDAQR